MENEADERFYPKLLKMDFVPFMRHYERYFTCLEILGHLGKDEKWLDCACGTGYGTNLLSNFCQNVIGYDIDEEAVIYASIEYGSQRVKFTNSLSDLEYLCDVVFSVETIEHMSESEGQRFLTTLNNSLKQDGTLVITTPILKKTNHQPSNKYHILEYSDEHFRRLLNQAGFIVEETKFVETLFTDGEVKDQGYYKCSKAK